jgi:hypothetical protein
VASTSFEHLVGYEIGCLKLDNSRLAGSDVIAARMEGGIGELDSSANRIRRPFP